VSAKRREPTISLAELAVGQSAWITGIRGNGAIRQRLLDMGVTRGTHVVVKRLAPLGDPIEIALKGYSLAIRRDEAQAITVRLDAE
jgi:ferrous iron transport protein A